jgi:malate dehydrogenase (oxaloacetate-decarboxylating)
MDIKQQALAMHAEKKGKLEIRSKVTVDSMEALSLAYTPGVAEPCKKIYENKEDVYTYTSKGNMVAIVTDGSAVLGLGNIGPEAGLPVMEGKAVLFKEFGNVDAVPICLDTNDVDEIVRTVKLISPSFGGVNLEDISAPRCFEIEARLKQELNIPVFHDDQHGTAIVVSAALINALRVVGKKVENIKVVINGGGSAGCAITKLLIKIGVINIILCDIDGALYRGKQGMSDSHVEMAGLTNPNNEQGLLSDVMAGADVFVGVSAPGIVSKEMVASMNNGACVFAMANPTPEIFPDEALAAGAAVVGTGRSDYPNQINNVLAFPGIFRGALDARATDITEEMKIAAAYAIANLITEAELNAEYVIPSPFDKRVVQHVSKAVIDAAKTDEMRRNIENQ